MEKTEDTRTNREKFEEFYETQWLHRRCCVKCEDTKYPKQFPKDKSIPFCVDCSKTLDTEERLALVKRLMDIQRKKEERFKY